MRDLGLRNDHELLARLSAVLIAVVSVGSLLAATSLDATTIIAALVLTFLSWRLWVGRRWAWAVLVVANAVGLLLLVINGVVGGALLNLLLLLLLLSPAMRRHVGFAATAPLSP